LLVEAMAYLSLLTTSKGHKLFFTLIRMRLYSSYNKIGIRAE